MVINMNNKIKLKKILKIAIISVVGVLFITCLTGFLILRSYIHKMNLVKGERESNWSQPIPEDILLDETEAGEKEVFNIPNASKKEINIIEEEIRRNMAENSMPISYDKDVFHVLLIGSDTRKTGEAGRSDAMIIVSINKKNRTITATSILRDIYLQIGKNSYNRINAAYAYGGAEHLLETIKYNFKIEIDRYITVDFFTFVEVIDALGGLELEVTGEEVPFINRYVKNINRLMKQPEEDNVISKAGTYLLNGKQVLSFARIRYIGNGDFDRTARQRRVLEQVFIKLKDMGVLEINELFDIILPQVTTNLTEGEIFSLILTLPTIRNYSIQQWSIPVEGTYSFKKIRGMDVIYIDMEENIKELQTRIFGDTP